jgi:hypothetical protein
MALLGLGLLGGIGHAQEPLKIDPSGWVSIPKAFSLGGDETGKPRFHFVWRLGGLDLAETSVADDRLFIQAGTGNVGIGTNQTPSKLSVDGTVYFSGNVGVGKTPDASAKLDVAGNVSIANGKLLVGDNTLMSSANKPYLRSDGVNVVLNAADGGKVYIAYDRGEIVFGGTDRAHA